MTYHPTKPQEVIINGRKCIVGWVLVPREPTLGMMDALATLRWPREGICPGCELPDQARFDAAHKAYTAMIAAAPAAPNPSTLEELLGDPRKSVACFTQGFEPK